MFQPFNYPKSLSIGPFAMIENACRNHMHYSSYGCTTRRQQRCCKAYRRAHLVSDIGWMPSPRAARFQSAHSSVEQAGINQLYVFWHSLHCLAVIFGFHLRFLGLFKAGLWQGSSSNCVAEDIQFRIHTTDVRYISNVNIRNKYPI